MNLDKSFSKQAALREFHVWNNIIFDNELKFVPNIRILKDLDDGDTDGYFVVDDDFEGCTIKINRTSARECPEAFSVILIHEMIHQLQWERELDIDHDDFFDSECERVRKITGWDVK